MGVQDFIEFMLTLGPVTYDTPFDEDTLVFRVGGKLFLLTNFSDWENATPKCNIKALPEDVLEYNANYTFVHPGYHMNKKHWITVELEDTKNWKLIKTWITNSYLLVYNGLTKKQKIELQEKKDNNDR